MDSPEGIQGLARTDWPQPVRRCIIGHMLPVDKKPADDIVSLLNSVGFATYRDTRKFTNLT
jgi:hypothetical protein